MSNTESNTPPAGTPSAFSQLVIMIATSALQQLGQIPDPSGQRGEISLEGAQGMIDILETLNTKTQGNLDEDEKKILNESLTMLRLSFVEIKQALERSGGAPSKETEREPEAPSAPSDIATGTATESKPDDGESKTRYRKSYG